VVLPVLATWISTRAVALHGVPFALSFACIAGLAAFAGLGPALVSILVSIASFNIHLTSVSHAFPMSPEHFERSVVLLASAFFLAALSWKQRKTEATLRNTLVSLQERTEALSQAQHASESATWVFDAESMQTFWDEGSAEIFGRPFQDHGMFPLPLEYILEEDRERLSTLVKNAMSSGDRLQFEFRVVWANGEVHWLETRGTRMKDSPNLWRGVTFNISRRKVVETALVRSEKLAAMGRLASTIAHEVNNPLESVTNLLYLVSADSELSESTRAYVALAEEELARLSNITRLTLTFARSGTVRGPVEVADIIESVLTVFHRKSELRNITVERFLAPGIEIEIPVHELRQIFINLIANAIDALTVERPILRLHLFRQLGKVIVLIEDNGQGITIIDQSRVFDAFFTTKNDVGTGIGLWVTKELVEKNGGRISVESGDLSDAMKTRFLLEFPSAPSATASDSVS
jgi:signal transduction histidine kinase